MARLVHGSNGWAPVQVGNSKCKRQGGPHVASWLRALRWASAVGFEGWQAACCEVFDLADTAGGTAHLLASMRTNERQHPPERRKSSTDLLPAALRAVVVERYGADFDDIAAGEQERIGAHYSIDAIIPYFEDLSALPEAVLGLEPEWVSTGAGVTALHDELRSLARQRRNDSAGPLVLGVDTEWADPESGTQPRLAIVQLAIRGRAWVIDALGSDTPVLGELIRWALETEEGVTALGFAFHGDLVVLQHFCGAELVARNLVDLQVLGRIKGEDTPSLKKMCGRTLGKALDKTEQCSDWARRPLTAQQFAYAALDATVLLEIFDVLHTASGRTAC
jgi:hypothetical protein